MNALKGSHSSHLLSRNVAAAMGLIKGIGEVKSTEIKDPHPEEVGKLNKANQNHSERRCRTVQCDHSQACQYLCSQK